MISQKMKKTDVQTYLKTESYKNATAYAPSEPKDAKTIAETVTKMMRSKTVTVLILSD